jgi:hypothetical protein
MYGPAAAAEPSVYLGDRPTWFHARIPAGDGASIPLSSAGALAGHDQVLEALVYATRPGEVSLEATWGSAALGASTAPDGTRGHVFTWRVPADQVPRDDALLVLKDASGALPPREPFDVTDDRGTSYVDAVSLVGPVAPVVDEGLRAYPVEPGGRLQLRLLEGRGGGTVHAAWLGPDGAPVRALELLRAAGWLSFDAADVPAGSRLVISSSARRAEAVAPVGRSPDPMGVSEGATHVIVAVPALLEESKRLARHRSARGVPSVAIPVTAVYEAFSFGERDPVAIRRFVSALSRRPGGVRFVLLAGDATLDRTDAIAEETIPAPMSRTKYNGATAADRLYAEPEGAPDAAPTGGPSIGRLPFRRAEEMAAYVDRLVRYETAPPAVESRRLLSFVTGEGRFNPAIDALIERYFRSLLAEHVPPAYRVEMTYANPRSPFFWPAPELGDKVVSDLNAGPLFYTYVGHGFAQGFDWVEAAGARWPIFHLKDVARVEARGLSPSVLVFACTTAIFDLLQGDGVGEALMKRPHGPVAYFGATRICHPAPNAVFGRALALQLLAGGRGRTLGEILDRARDEMLSSRRTSIEEGLISVSLPAADRDLGRLYREAAHLYVLLGDPALVPALPADDLEVAVETLDEGARLRATVKGPLPEGAEVSWALEGTRAYVPDDLPAAKDPTDPAEAEKVRLTHALANARSFASGTARVAGGRAVVELEVPEPARGHTLVLQVASLSGGDVHQGATTIR